MNWITDQVAIGDYREAQDSELLRREGIRSVLGLIGTLRGRVAAELGLQRIEISLLLDGPGNDLRFFQQVVATLAELAEEAPPVLVHCRAGRSRSAAVVAGYLMQSLGIDADEALMRVAARREIFVAPELRALLERLV